MLDERMRRELGLTDDQTKRLRELRLQAQKSAIRSRADLETKQLELQELLNAQTPDRAAIDRTIREIGEQHATQMKADIDMRLGLQSVLTPDQRKKMNDLRERHFNERVPGPGGPGARGGPGRPESRTPAQPRRPTTPSPAPAPPQQQ
jgi:Spy/CpxP family protein refolding chaperone